MSILLAVTAGVSAASGAISNIALPPSISLQSSLPTASSATLEVNSNGLLIWSTTEHAPQQFPWNEGGRFNNQYQIQLRVVTGPSPAGQAVGQRLDVPASGSLRFTWERLSLGTTTGSYVLEIYSKVSNKLVASTPVGLSLQYFQRDYGLVLPAPLSLSTTGTSARYVDLSLTGASNNSLTTNRTGTTASYNWNPQGHNRALFQVRLVHVSGTAPNAGSGTGSWRAASSNSNWRWDRSAVGTTNGSTRLEIRDATTETILTQCPVTVHLEMETTTYTLTVQDHPFWICIPDPKTGEESCNWGSLGIGGSAITPSTYRGATIVALISEGASTWGSLRLSLSGNRPQNFFTSITTGGLTRTSSSASYSYLPELDETRWRWSDTDPDWTVGQNTQVIIT